MGKDIKIKNYKKVDTKDSKSKPNGWLLEILNERDKSAKPMKGQVYLTVAEPKSFKGYHMHARADYLVTCLKGKIKEIVCRGPNNKKEVKMGDNNFKTVFIPKGCPHAISNIGNKPAYVLIYRYPAWNPKSKEQMDIQPKDINKSETWREIRKQIKQFKK